MHAHTHVRARTRTHTHTHTHKDLGLLITGIPAIDVEDLRSHTIIEPARLCAQGERLVAMWWEVVEVHLHPHLTPTPYANTYTCINIYTP